MAACSRISGIMSSVTAHAPDRGGTQERHPRETGVARPRTGRPAGPPMTSTASGVQLDSRAARTSLAIAWEGLRGASRVPLPGGVVAVLGPARLDHQDELAELGGVAPAPADARRCGRSPRR